MSKQLIENCKVISVNSLKLTSLNAVSIEINSQVIGITTSKCNYGGFRSWFICPVCGKRIGNLYKPLGEYLYTCRDCSNLTYISSRLRRSRYEQTSKQLLKFTVCKKMQPTISIN